MYNGDAVLDINKSKSGPLVSILLPTYGRAENLSGIIEKLLKQTYTNIEIIVADDASPDDTPSVVSNFLCDSRVKYIRRETNLGPYLNYYTTLCFDAKGDYVFYHSDDDYIIDDCWLEESVSIMMNSDSIGLVHSGYAFFFEDSKSTRDVVLDVDCVVGAQEFITRFSPDDHMLHTFLFARHGVVDYILKNIGWGQAEYMHPLEPVFASICGKNVSYIPRVTMHYVVHDNQQANKEARFGLLKFVPAFAQYLKLMYAVEKSYLNSSDLATTRLETFIFNAYNAYVQPYDMVESRYLQECICVLQDSDKNINNIIYGYGKLGHKLYKKCLDLSINISAVVDDSCSHDVTNQDVKIDTIDSILKFGDGAYLVVIASLSQDVVIKILKNIFQSNYKKNSDRVFFSKTLF